MQNHRIDVAGEPGKQVLVRDDDRSGVCQTTRRTGWSLCYRAECNPIAIYSSRVSMRLPPPPIPA